MILLTLMEKILNGFFAIIPRRKPEMKGIKAAQLIAHRGAHNNQAGIFENTLEAFRLAKKAGCWGIELDVHSTADQILVVNHDPTLNRLWQQNATISDLNFSTLRSLAPQIPTLSEVIAEFGEEMHLFIELKNPVQETLLMQDLQHLSPCKDYHLLALSPHIFNSLSQFPRQSLLLVAMHNNIAQFCNLSINKNYGGVLGNYLLLTDRRIGQLKERGQKFGVGFVNSKNSLFREINRGIPWIFTNEAVAVGHYLLELHSKT